MGHDPGRAAVACLAILAVLFAASAFPPAGLGGFPGGIGDAPGGGPDDGVRNGGTNPERTAVDPTTVDPGTTVDDGNGPDGTTTADDDTATPTATPTETTTETTAAGSSSGGNGPGIGSLIGDAVLAAVLFVGVTALFVTAGITLGVVVPHRVGPGGKLVLEVAGRRVDVGGALSGLSRGSMRFVFGLSTATGRLLTGLGSAASAAADSLTAIGTGGGRALLSIPRGLGQGLATAGRGLGSALAAVPAGFGSVLAGIGSSETASAPTADPRAGANDADTDTGEQDEGAEPPQSVEEAWDRFTDRVRIRDRSSRTPGEFARVAASRGVPADAVGRLTRTFREVRYGDRPADESRLDRAREAWANIRDHFAGEDGT